METITKEYDLSKYKYCIGMPAGRDLHPYVVLSMLFTANEFSKMGNPLCYAFELQNSIICSARNKVVHTFLTKTDADVLVFVDSDIAWKTEDFIKLAALATEHRVVGSPYSTKNDVDPKIFVNMNRDKDGKPIRNELGLVSVYGMGAGFLAIRRDVFEELMPHTEQYKDDTDEHYYRFFKVDTQDGFLVGEDIYFLKRWVKDFGHEAWAIPDLELGHIGNKVYKTSLYNASNFKEDL